MPSPSKNFTIISDSAIDADSPIDTTLMTGLRDNDIHLQEWLGKDYTAAPNHNHDGINSASATVGDGAITGAKMSKAPTGEWSTTLNPGSTSSALMPGVYAMLDTTGDLKLEAYLFGSWRRCADGLNGSIVYSNGNNIRIANTNTGASRTFYYFSF